MKRRLILMVQTRRFGRYMRYGIDAVEMVKWVKPLLLDDEEFTTDVALGNT